ncbi:MAG: hypothetical protein HY014_05410 [Acidobacteria bacterium]|nr:hypothetical protein [Acidobacteriota bacterium]MBI3487590.1 hypothetical protein [Acidobacteriota bacterium]
MSDNEVNVKISADIKSFLQGMKEASENVEKSTAAIKGDLGSMIESFEHLGFASLAIGVVGLAFEGLKESAEFIKESIEETHELARSFKDLAYQTGISHEELNNLNTAQTLEGGTIQELEGWMKGATKAIKANADMLVENGIAASKAELMAMPFTDYLKKVMAAAESIHDPMRRGIFLQEALGRAGMEAAPQIREMLEQLEVAPETLRRYGRAIGQDNVEDMERFEHATGKVKIATQGLKQTLAETFGDNLVTAKERWADFVSNWSAGLHELLGDGPNVAIRKQIEAMKKEIAKGQEEIRAMGGVAPEMPGEQGHEQEVGKKIHINEEINDAKKAAADRLAIRRLTDGAIIRSAEYVFQEQVKNDKELVASSAMTQAEMEADLRRAAKERLDTVMSALKDEEKANARMPVELKATLDKEKQAQEQYSASMLELGRQTSEQARKDKEKTDAEAEKARKQNLELAKRGAQDKLNLVHSELEAKERVLDQDLAFGRINEDQWVAMRKAGVAQELKAQLDALNTEQKAAEGDLVHWTKIENQKSALRRKADGDIQKLDIEAVNRSKTRWDGFFSSMTGGWESAVKGLIHGTLTWGDAFKEVLNQGLDGLISFFVRWGEEEAIKWATSEAMGRTGRTEEATGAAAVYAINAMASVAAIPFWGWAAAPGVGAEAYGAGLAFAGLASAEGGWERVPSDQVAQLHKNEQVLPASYAEGLRSLVASHQTGEGQQSGGETHVHFHGTLIDSTFWQKHQGPIIQTVQDAIRNRRTK